MFLYADEPPLDDLYDDLDGLDVQEVPFEHQQGAPTKKAVTLSGEVPEGYNVGVHVLGYGRRNGVWKQVLWDGQDGTELAPYSQVELLRFPGETPEAELLAGSLREWQRLKKAHGGAYRYEVVFSSMVGEYGKMTFEVRDDRVLRVCLYAGRLLADDFGTGARIDDLRFLGEDAEARVFTTAADDAGHSR